MTDVLTCPRCGPEWGLILLPDEVRDRRVVEGVLGCPNCRERYRVRGGIADLRVGGSEGAVAEEESSVDAKVDRPAEATPELREGAVRLGALLGLAEVKGTVLLAGSASWWAGSLAALLEGVEVVSVSEAVESGAGDGAAAAGVSRVLARGSLPIRTGGLAAAAVTGTAVELVEEAVRSVRPAGRILLEPAGPELAARAEAAGGGRVAMDGKTLVVARRR